MADKIGTYHLADNPDLYEIQRTNNFEFVVTGISSLLTPGIAEELAEDTDFIKNGQEVLRLSVSKSSIPSFTQSVITISRGNNKFKYAGAIEYKSGSLVINDYIGAKSKACLMAWRSLSYNEMTEKVGNASSYKKECTLIEYTPNYEVSCYWTLYGCWISALDFDDSDAENPGKKTVTATIEYDRAIPHFPE